MSDLKIDRISLIVGRKTHNQSIKNPISMSKSLEDTVAPVGLHPHGSSGQGLRGLLDPQGKQKLSKILMACNCYLAPSYAVCFI